VVRVDSSTVLVVVEGGADALRSCGVDAECNPSEQAVRDVVSKQGVLDHGVNTVGAGLTLENVIVGIERQGLRVRVVRLENLHSRDQGLVKEHLADMASPYSVSNRAVVVLSRVGRVHKEVNVVCTAEIVT
jgi:hypothetical protein